MSMPADNERVFSVEKRARERLGEICSQRKFQTSQFSGSEQTHISEADRAEKGHTRSISDRFWDSCGDSHKRHWRTHSWDSPSTSLSLLTAVDDRPVCIALFLAGAGGPEYYYHNIPKQRRGTSHPGEEHCQVFDTPQIMGPNHISFQLCAPHNASPRERRSYTM